jgi:lipopolysaccharide export system protein LptA
MAGRGRPALLPGLFLLAGLTVGAPAPAAAQSTGELFAGFQSNSKDPVQVDAQALDVSEEGKQRISVFSGGVVVVRGKTTLKADTIKLYSDLGVKTVKNDAFSRIEASGKVYVNSGEQTVTGSQAVVDMKAQLITLSGNVVLSQGSSVMTGDRLIVNLKTGSARLEQAPGKRIQGVITPESMKGATAKDAGPKAP